MNPQDQEEPQYFCSIYDNGCRNQSLIGNSQRDYNNWLQHIEDLHPTQHLQWAETGHGFGQWPLQAVAMSLLEQGREIFGSSDQSEGSSSQ
jgi:hypothetical protein